MIVGTTMSTLERKRISDMRRDEKLPIAIIGYGFVGSAVHSAFIPEHTYCRVVDPNVEVPDYGAESVTLDKLCEEKNSWLTFLCLPTLSQEDGSVDVSIVDEVLTKLNEAYFDGVIVLKSTITPDYLNTIQDKFPFLALVYNPEFLTAANAKKDILNPRFQVFGGDGDFCQYVEKFYYTHTNIKVVPSFKTTMEAASMVKYAINSWLATKVVFMNELHTLFHEENCVDSWELFTSILGCDDRIGPSHMKVPGPDGFGYGGYCFPKDTLAFERYASSLGVDLTVLQQAIETNEAIWMRQ
jgi:UDPglucose 6-dehydrogenase